MPASHGVSGPLHQTKSKTKKKILKCARHHCVLPVSWYPVGLARDFLVGCTKPLHNVLVQLLVGQPLACVAHRALEGRIRLSDSYASSEGPPGCHIRAGASGVCWVAQTIARSTHGTSSTKPSSPSNKQSHSSASMRKRVVSILPLRVSAAVSTHATAARQQQTRSSCTQNSKLGTCRTQQLHDPAQQHAITTTA